MNVSGKNIRVLLSKPLKWFCVLLILLISAFSFAYNHHAAIAPMVKVIQPKTELPPHNPLISGLIKKYTAALLLPANTPPDITKDVCGTSTTLTPIFPAPGIYDNSTLIWNDGSTQSTLNVTTSGTYWWQVTGPSVVTNGNFSAAASSPNTAPVGFTSDYTYMTTASTCTGCCCGVLSTEGTYGVTTDPSILHTNFASFKDHTNGSGKMLVVNGSSVINKAVWKQNITIVANTDYVFSFWATSATSQSPAILQFSLNGSPLGSNVTLSPANGTWQYFTATWNSGTNSGSLPIALVNQNTATTGNDFAVDDIVFAPVYRQNIIVNLNPIPVLSVIGAICDVSSYDLTKTIIGYAPGTYTYTFKDGSGNTLSGAQITAAPIGTYTITATNAAGCTSNPQNTTVTINPVPTLLVTSPPAQCFPFDLKNAINGRDDNTYTYTYQNGATTLGSSVVSASGTYTITATNKATGCVSSPQNVTVTINQTTSLSVRNQTVVCGTTTYDLYNAVRNPPSGYTYIYEDMAGNVLYTGTNFTVNENATNKYQIIAKEPSGCQSKPLTVTITYSTPFLSVITTPPAQCGGTYDLTQAINGWDPTTYTYKDGSGNVLARPTNIATSGTYTITKTNNTTGCASAPQTVTITINPIPFLSLTSPAPQCGGTFDLSTAITNNDPTVTYTYSSGASSVVTTSGTYTITATKNGCSTTSALNVTINPLPILSVTSPAPQCGGTFDLSTAITNYDATVTYTYSSGASSVVATSGTYTITATKNGCSTPATVTVTINPLPVLALTSPAPQCVTYDLTQTIVGGYDPTYTYVFKDPSGNVITLANAQAITQSGTYTITKQNNSTLCTSLPQSTTVTISPNPPKPGIIISTPY
jgi:hypothetical protein